MRITLTDIFNLTGSVIYNPDNFKSVSKVSIDSRTIGKGAMYVAIKGEKFDGHNFIRDAIKKGASSIIINKNRLKNFKDITCTIITVPDTIKAYGELASFFRNKFKGTVISLTGSNGKTTTKEILSTLLSEKYKVQKTEANNNNHIGVPKTIFSLKQNTEVLLLEHGTNHFGEIEYTAKIAKPDYALLTNIGDSHLKYLGDKEGVYNEKSSLFNETLKNNGILFINNDDKIIREKTKKIKNKISFGFKGKPDIKGKVLNYTDDGRTRLSVTYKNKNIEFVLPLFGKSNAENFLAAISIAFALGLSVTSIKKGISKVQQVKGRLFVERFHNFILIDDSYNSNPASVKVALDLINKVKIYNTKTVILADMLELGKDAKLMHVQLRDIILKSKITNLYLIGKLMKNLAVVLSNSKINVEYFSSRNSLKKFINKKNFRNEIILIKGSRGMRTEVFVEQIKEKEN